MTFRTNRIDDHSISFRSLETPSRSVGSNDCACKEATEQIHRFGNELESHTQGTQVTRCILDPRIDRAGGEVKMPPGITPALRRFGRYPGLPAHKRLTSLIAIIFSALLTIIALWGSAPALALLVQTALGIEPYVPRVTIALILMITPVALIRRTNFENNVPMWVCYLAYAETIRDEILKSPAERLVVTLLVLLLANYTWNWVRKGTEKSAGE